LNAPSTGVTHIETQDIDLAHEHMAAIDVFRIAKNAFLWLAAGAIGVHLVAFVVVLVRSDGAEGLGPWADRFEQTLAVAGFVARASVLVINGIFLISLLVCLSARMGGAAALARGSVFALVALAMVTPWISPSDSPGFTSALYGSADIYRAGRADAAIGGIGFIRFGLCPILVVVMMLLSQWSYRRAYRKMVIAPPTRLPIHEV